VHNSRYISTPVGCTERLTITSDHVMLMNAFCGGVAHTQRITQWGDSRAVPRLTDSVYLAHRHRLMTAWEFRSDLFGYLAYFEQRDLHHFFAPSKEFYDDDALTYRREVTKLSPSLPSQAGRAYAHFERILAERMERRISPRAQAVRTKGLPRPPRETTVRGIARPDLDIRRLARLLVDVSVADSDSPGRTRPR